MVGLEREAAVVKAAQRGEQWAQDRLVAAYLPLVYNIVGRALNGHADVDDVVQETMIAAVSRLRTLRSPGSFRPWLVAIAMNQVRGHWHAARRAPDAGLGQALDVADPGADFADLTILRLGLSGQRREVAEATRWLDAEDRSLLSLWWLEAAGELTRAEVAAAMELSAQHTAVRVQRMKAQLETARLVVRALAAVPRCVLLDDVLLGWDGVPSALWRKRIARHTRECTVCSGHEAGLVPAEGLLVGLGLLPVGAGLAALVTVRSGGGAMAPAGHGEPYAQPYASGPGGEADDRAVTAALPRPRSGSHARSSGGRSSGGRSPGGRRGERLRRRSRRRVLLAGGLALLVGGGGFATLTLLRPDAKEAETLVTEAAPGTPLTSGPPVSSAPASASATPSPSASASAGRTASPRPEPTPSRTRTTKPAPPRPAPTRTTQSQRPEVPLSDAQEVTRIVNAERARNGCGPVRQNARLDAAAQGHSRDMRARDFFDHTNPDGAGPGERVTAAGYRWSTYGENIARGQQSPESVMESWMNSPGHRANILNCSFKEIGVGIEQGDGGPWWTQVFGAAQ
ncbi:sigma-70 family RNA polymerase sigma factor [Streptomyces sp. NPDC001941]|uniref:sigma-70 family RNA polymerase sigma factor n=1 Tax=Streptomyces sp. NPDC001941 TaxID=3154659 RepID=UPI003325785E